MSVAVVTGASSGIGAATARRLATEGFHVVAAARRADRLRELVAGIVGAGGAATAVACDITDDTSVAELARRAGGTVDLLVNNAGGARGTDQIADAHVDDWRWLYEVNVLGTLRVTLALLPALVASGAGTIVTVG